MADKVVINDVHPNYDGEYDLDVSSFTMGELHEIKKLTGLRLGEFEEAAAAQDLDFIVALAIVALKRAGRQIVPKLIWDAEAGSIVYQSDDPEPEGDAVPPAVAKPRSKNSVG
jgi:hypothetical protein